MPSASAYAGLGMQALEPCGVERVGSEREPVTGRDRGDGVGAQAGAQLGHIHLHQLLRRRRRWARPQRVDKPVDRDNLVWSKQQGQQRRPDLRGADTDLSPVPRNLERTQDPILQHRLPRSTPRVTAYTDPKAAPRRVRHMTSTASSAYVVVHDVAASWHDYERLAGVIDSTATPGLLLHAAGRTEEGFRTIDVWQDRATWRHHRDRWDAALDAIETPPVVRELDATHVTGTATTAGRGDNREERR